MASLREMREAAKRAFDSKIQGPVEEIKTVGNEGSTHDPRKLPKLEEENKKRKKEKEEENK